ncbi:YolD-like family protein [Paenibacillus alvei]|uniref:YolD-like family protein n=1 Tax=Paenibacillus alvei TaxID=44250 RepID=A0ABT4H1N5_PAEAL|nr:YolD-like family protein [Paenibacillus alvei]MCY9542612.1 YolD-like family protein [Paenibacillus alvei]MCY9706497.1 YolD-like family protein [Paenibacillus alvei]MCY9736468.1 YolD-like family protein [Paenibacillus alvei]MCY9758097.1 YolD-like family protein [Paenibacillus alvei]MCY9762885.1 YolD-like family protein [Paenibacillus alvei]
MSKLNGNGIYESSRFIIPQHREALLVYQHERARRTRPQIDDQEWEVIGGKLQQSMNERETITVRVFDPFAYKEEAGVVVDIDTYQQRFKLLSKDDWQWIKIEDVMEVSI